MDDFRKTKDDLEEEQRQLAAKTISNAEVPKAKRARKKEKTKLSFADDDPSDSPPKKRFAKNPGVDTSFLPDREREERERIEREELRKEWLAEQERVKAEVIEITYSYWDGSGHRKSVEVGSAHHSLIPV